MSLQPRDAGSLDYGTVFDEGITRTRLNELTQAFMAKLMKEDMEKMTDKARRAFKPVPRFQLPQDKNIEEVYGERARKLAEKIIEQERQNYVDARAERDKTLLVEIKRKLRSIVWTVDDKGKATKLKRIVERVAKGNRGICEVHYVGDHDFERLNQINRLKGRLNQLSSFIPYYPEEIKKLYNEARAVASLEYEYKKKEKPKPQPRSIEKPAKIKKTKKPVKTKKKAKT